MKLSLSHFLTNETQLYGNRGKVVISKSASISSGDSVNETTLNTTLHAGTHIDLPYHFYENGQTLADFDIDFWFFEKVGFIEPDVQNSVLENDIIDSMKSIDKNIEILLIKTGMGKYRNDSKYWEENIGIAPAVYDFLVEKFPNIRVMGFDSISITSFTDRPLGKEAHKRFLNPKRPILILEDMKLERVNRYVKFKKVIISPMWIDKADGLPCTVFAEII